MQGDEKLQDVSAQGLDVLAADMATLGEIERKRQFHPVADDRGTLVA